MSAAAAGLSVPVCLCVSVYLCAVFIVFLLRSVSLTHSVSEGSTLEVYQADPRPCVFSQAIKVSGRLLDLS